MKTEQPIQALLSAIKNLEEAEIPYSLALQAIQHQPRFEQTSCSQCGQEFGPGNHGYSHCEDHQQELQMNKFNIAYTSEMGHAADLYIRSKAFGNQTNLPAQFKWHEVFDLMLNLAEETPEKFSSSSEKALATELEPQETLGQASDSLTSDCRSIPMDEVERKQDENS